MTRADETSAERDASSFSRRAVPAMPPRYRHAKDLTPRQRQRVGKILLGPVLFRSFLPSVVIWFTFIAIEIGIAEKAIPGIDLNGWPFILVAYPISCLVFAGAMAVTHVLMIRWLLRYRTGRRGRLVALRDVLRPMDDRSSRWRRRRLSLYGVAKHELELSHSLWRSDGVVR
jgi:hypothetical protein